RARRGGRSAGNRRRRMARIPDFDRYGIELGAEPLCRDLCENRIDAVANFMRRGLHPHIAIGHQSHTRRGWTGMRWIECGRATEANQPIAITHRAWLRRSLFPAERRPGLVVTLHQRAA